MRVLLINTSERLGGAAIAASRLMESLKNHGIKAKLLVRDKQTDQITVVALGQSWRMIWKFVWERIVIWKANHFKKDNIFAVDGEKLVVVYGLKGYIVADAGDVLLICPKSEEQRIKQMVNDVKMTLGDKYL